MKPFDEEMRLAEEIGRSPEKIKKMIDQSDNRPPAYYVYNSTQSSEESPRMKIDVKKLKKQDYAAFGRQIKEEKD